MEAMSSARATKKSAFSCHPCRTRKVRCDGEKPSCNRCRDRGETCVYRLPPTLSYTDRLEERVRELEEALKRMHGDSSGREGQRKSSTASATGSSSAVSDHVSDHHVSPPADPDFGRPSPAPSADTDTCRRFRGFKLDDKGLITYHGATSFFQIPASNGTVAGVDEEAPLAPERSARRQRLVSNAWQQRALESQSGMPEPFRYLLDLHWCWIQPLFNFIYRPAFTRDVGVIGPYYSHTLMNAVISHSIRWGRSDAGTRKLLEPYDQGRLFGRQARSLIFNELMAGSCTIPTVQTLLLLSAQECSAGNSTQAWVYSGTAFRLIDHMGICIDGQRYAGNIALSDEDMEIRRRLFWSCYFWDKIISLYLGRSPSLQSSHVSPPQMMLDDSSETELWTPHGVIFPAGVQYPATAAHSTSCFMSMCKLSVIFNQILMHVYDPLQQNSPHEIKCCIADQGRELGQWWDELPPFLRIDTAVLPLFAPPSHVVTLNCLYHTFRILLYRSTLTRRCDPAEAPCRRDPQHLLACVGSAVSIIAIFDLFCRTFGEGHCILSLSYSVYIAASIFLLQVQACRQNEQALRRLLFCIDSLERVKHINPVIISAVAPIRKALEQLGLGLVGPLPSANQSPVATAADDMADRTTSSSIGNSGGSIPTTLPRDRRYPYPPAPSRSHQKLYKTHPDDLMVPDGVFEAVATLEPMGAMLPFE